MWKITYRDPIENSMCYRTITIISRTIYFDVACGQQCIVCDLDETTRVKVFKYALLSMEKIDL